MPTKKVRRIHAAKLHGDEFSYEPKTVMLSRHIETTVRDKNGRELWSHPERQTHGDYTEFDELSLKEAARLLVDLADSIGFAASNTPDRVLHFYRKVSDLADANGGNWPGADVVDLVQEFFAAYGLSVKGGVTDKEES